MVKGSCHDLCASGAVYHQQCNVNFRTSKDIPKNFLCDEQLSAKKKHGRPTGTIDKDEALRRVALYLEENDDEQIDYCG